MKRILTALAVLFLCVSGASSQQTLPPNTVIGRLGIGPGPAQSIPFAVLSSNLVGSGSGIFGLTLSGDANYAMVGTDRTVLINAALTVPRTVTLFAAATLATGQQICIADAFGGVTSTNTLTVARAGSDTVNSTTSAVIGGAFGEICLISDGISKWTNGGVQFTQAGTGAVTRSLDSKAKELPSLKDFKAVCDGSTDDATAVTNAAAAYSLVMGTGALSSTGTKCKVSTAANALTGKLFGWNTQLVDGSNNQRGYFFSSVSANKAYTATNEDSVDTAFNGNFTGSQFVVEHRITGAATLTQPTTGYVYSPWAYPYYTFLYNESGFNNSTTANVGRTAAVALRTRLYQHGQGDIVAHNCSGFGDTTRAGATNFLANPAIVCINGEFTAGAAGLYLNPLEFQLVDNGFDAAGIGNVLNLNRTVNTGALGVTWGGERVQSTGSKAIDFVLSATGPILTGLDFTQATFTAAQIGSAWPANARQYLNATSGGTFVVSAGTTWMEYNSGNACVAFVVNNRSTVCIDANAHIRVQGTAPTISAGCNGAGSSIIGSDIAGTVTGQTAAATTCTILFNVAYANTPHCTASGQSSPLTGALTPSTTTLVVNFGSTANYKWSYNCYAQGGG